MYFWVTAEWRDFETHITDQTLISVMAVRIWSYLKLILTKHKSFKVPLIPQERVFLEHTSISFFFLHFFRLYSAYVF